MRVSRDWRAVFSLVRAVLGNSARASLLTARVAGLADPDKGVCSFRKLGLANGVLIWDLSFKKFIFR